MFQKYTILFTIDLLHEYYLNRRCRNLQIVPAGDCLSAFKKADMLGRNLESRYVALIRENEEGAPFHNTSDQKRYRNDFHKTVFRFYLKTTDPLFLNYTGMDPASAGRQKLYFSNTAGNSQNGYLFLSAPVEPFANDTAYMPGDLARDARTGLVYEALSGYTAKKKAELNDAALWAPKDLLHAGTPVADHAVGKAYAAGEVVRKPDTDSVFEAVRRHISTGTKDLSNPSLWADRGQGQVQFVNKNDLIHYSGDKYVFALTEPAKKVEVSIFGFNYSDSSPAYDLPVRETEVKTFDQPATAVTIDFASLPRGKYAIKVNKETRTVYYDPALHAGDVLGVIEIFNHLPAGDAYSFLFKGEQIRTANYSILFPARSVLWKYVRKDGRAKTITDTGATGYTFDVEDNNFISSRPIPLSEGAVRTLKLEFSSSDFGLAPLPNPSVERFSRCTRNGHDYLCSEVYLNY